MRASYNKIHNRLLLLCMLVFSQASHASMGQERYETGTIIFSVGESNNQAQMNNTDILPTYETMAGLSYKSESYPDTTLHVGYSYLNEKTPILDKVILTPTENNFSSHNVLAGVSIDF